MYRNGQISIIVLGFAVLLLIAIGAIGYFTVRNSTQLTQPASSTQSLQSAPTSSKKIITTQTNQSSLPVISKLNPSSGPIGTKVTISGNGFMSSNNTVIFGMGIGSRYPNFISNDGRTIVFSIPSQDNPMCPDSSPRCPLRMPSPITLGAYAVSVTNSNGVSNNLTFTVTQ